jgi:acetyltransferase-like isoleucine patch superfamily enzyme
MARLAGLFAKSGLRLTIFSWYSYGKTLENCILNLLPPPIRTLFFKVALKNFGKGSFIDYGFYFRFPKKISIGSGVEINQNCNFMPSSHLKNATITLGDSVILGPSVTLLCAGQDKINDSREDVGGPIVIKQGAYIGANVIIRYNVVIGEGATVGAGSIIVKSVPDFAVVVGNPARSLN